MSKIIVTQGMARAAVRVYEDMTGAALPDADGADIQIAIAMIVAALDAIQGEVGDEEAH